MKKSILFVDGDSASLESFRLLLGPQESEWELRSATSGLEALAMMDGATSHVVITNSAIPGMSGAQFLHEVMAKHPHTARFILAGYAEQESVIQSIALAHQYLPKPCDRNTLRSALERVNAADVFLQNGQLKELVTGMTVAPCLPPLYFQILQEIQSPYVSMERIGDLIAQDDAARAKLVHSVNSAFLGLSQQISTPGQAIRLLGLNTVRALLLAIHTFACFAQASAGGISWETVWNHSVAVGAFARKISQGLETEVMTVDESFLGGLLHDIGKLLLLSNSPRQYEQAIGMAREKGIPLIQAEQEVFGATHAAVAGYLLGQWGLPIPILEAVAFHHAPENNIQETFTPLTAVHVADVLEHEHARDRDGLLPPEFSQTHLSNLALLDVVPIWREAFADLSAKNEAV